MAYIGLYALAFGWAEDDGDPDTTSGGGVNVRGPAVVAAFVGGVAASIAGVVVLVSNDTEVRLSAPASRQRTAGGSSSDALSLELPLGLAITERGVVF